MDVGLSAAGLLADDELSGCCEGRSVMELIEQLTSCREHLFGGVGVGKKLHAIDRVVGRGFPRAAQHQYRHKRQAVSQFRHERWSAHAGYVQAADDQTEVAGKLRLFDQTESLGCVRDASYIMEPLLKRRHACKRLQGVVLH